MDLIVEREREEEVRGRGERKRKRANCCQHKEEKGAMDCADDKAL